MILDRAALVAKGINDWAFGFADVVRYRDLDTYNHVNNVVYHSWFEDIRVMFFDHLDLNRHSQNDALPVMRTADISFNKQILAGADYMVLTRPTKIGNSSFVLAYQVRCENEVMVEGNSVIVMSDLAAGKAVPLTANQRERIGAYL